MTGMNLNTGRIMEGKYTASQKTETYSGSGGASTFSGMLEELCGKPETDSTQRERDSQEKDDRKKAETDWLSGIQLLQAGKADDAAWKLSQEASAGEEGSSGALSPVETTIEKTKPSGNPQQCGAAGQEQEFVPGTAVLTGTEQTGAETVKEGKAVEAGLPGLKGMAERPEETGMAEESGVSEVSGMTRRSGLPEESGSVETISMQERMRMPGGDSGKGESGKAEEGGKPEETGKTEEGRPEARKPEEGKPERTENFEKPENSEKTENFEKPENSEKTENTEKTGKAGKAIRNGDSRAEERTGSTEKNRVTAATAEIGRIGELKKTEGSGETEKYEKKTEKEEDGKSAEARRLEGNGRTGRGKPDLRNGEKTEERTTERTAAWSVFSGTDRAQNAEGPLQEFSSELRQTDSGAEAARLQQLTERLTEILSQSRAENAPLLIRLEPEGLGSITLELRQEGTQNMLFIRTEQEKTLQLLKEGAGRMASVLSAHTGTGTRVQILERRDESSTASNLQEDTSSREQHSPEGQGEGKRALEQKLLQQRKEQQQTDSQTFLSRMRLGLV